MRKGIYTGYKTSRTTEQLKKMLLEEKEAMIKKIKPKREPNDYYDPNDYHDYDNEKMGQLTKPKLWYLLVILKKSRHFSGRGRGRNGDNLFG